MMIVVDTPLSSQLNFPGVVIFKKAASRHPAWSCDEPLWRSSVVDQVPFVARYTARESSTAAHSSHHLPISRGKSGSEQTADRCTSAANLFASP